MAVGNIVIHTHTHTHTDRRPHARTYAGTHTHAGTQTHAGTHTHAHTHTREGDGGVLTVKAVGPL